MSARDVMRTLSVRRTHGCWFAAKLLLRFPAAAQRQSRVAGQHDMVGYEELRRRANRPIGLHHMPLGATTEITQHRMGDFYSKCSRPFASSCKPLLEFAAQCLATTTSARP